MEESIHVTFDENRKGTENLLNPEEEEEFKFYVSTQDEPSPSSVEYEDDDDRPVSSSRILHVNFSKEPNQSNNQDNDVQEKLAPLEEHVEEPGGDIQQSS